jgi:shikimate kinase
MQNIVLIGFMASGKSTLGKKLAKKLNFEFIDSDKEIEKLHGKSISEIFSEFGESAFREMENKFIHSLQEKKNFVLSTGGGLPCFFDNILLLNELGQTFYLKLSSKELTKRILNAKNERPLAKGKSREELFDFVNNLLSEREKFYFQATKTLIGREQNIKFIIENLYKLT